MQLRAPGCPVIIVGTHMDKVQDPTRVRDLENKAEERYSNIQHYPKVRADARTCT